MKGFAAPETRAQEPATARVRCRMPLLVHKRFLVVDPRGALVELELVFVPAGHWKRTPALSAAPAWRTWGIGPFVLAFRIRFGLS